MVVSAHTGYWPRTTAYVPSTGTKKMCMHNFQTQAAYGYMGSIRAEINRRYAVRSTTGHWNFGPYGARKLPGSFM